MLRYISFPCFQSVVVLMDGPGRVGSGRSRRRRAKAPPMSTARSLHPSLPPFSIVSFISSLVGFMFSLLLLSPYIIVVVIAEDGRPRSLSCDLSSCNLASCLSPRLWHPLAFCPRWIRRPSRATTRPSLSTSSRWAPPACLGSR
jgi:hypothetical protein